MEDFVDHMDCSPIELTPVPIFDIFSEELLLRFISFLPPKDICEYRAVSRKWKELSEDQPFLWKLLCERSGIQTKTAHKSWEWEYKARMRVFTSEPTGTTIGTFVDSDGHTYAGDWLDGKREGWGVSKTTNGIYYEGEWKDNKKSGQGKQDWSDGTKYVGAFLNGTKHGFGKLSWVSGSIFEGEWQNDVMEGHGIFTWPRGDTYVGTWAQGKKEGKGRMVWGEGIWNGDVYDGEWREDLQEGTGSYSWNDGRVYSGDWLAHKRHGVNGHHSWPDGSYYSGSFVDGKRQGQGEMVWKDAKSWKGEWKDDEIADNHSSPYISGRMWNKFFILPKDEQRKAVLKFMANQPNTAQPVLVRSS